MEMKDLNHSQLILLAILISFVTSIATGIATVALMEQAPTGVVQPINKVIKETVEKVIRVEAPKQDVLSEEEIKVLIDKILEERVVPESPKLESEVPIITEPVSDGTTPISTVDVDMPIVPAKEPPLTNQ